MRVNSSLCFFRVANIAPLNLNVTGKIIPGSSEVKLLGITIDNQLRFKKHIKDLFNYHALLRIRIHST